MRLIREPNFLHWFALATLSGCLWFLAVTPFDFSALAWIAAVPMLFAVDRARTLRQALLLGWWAGVVETAGGFYWLIDLMQRFADFPWVGAAGVFFLFCAGRALIFLLFSVIVRAIRRRQRLPMTLLAPLAMVCSELVVPQIFPCGQWISQAWQPHVIQIAELTGPLGVTALLMLINGALYDVMTCGRAARIPALAAAGILAAVLIFGVVRMRQIDQLTAHAPRLKVGLVQPNFAYTIDGELSRDEAIRQLSVLQVQSLKLEQTGAQLIVWSEGAYPIALPRDFAADFASGSIGMVRGEVRVPMVIGAETYDPAHEEGFNSALLLDAEGRATGRYDKVRLLAFGEYIPGIETFPWLRKFIPEGAGRFAPGLGPTVMSVNDSAGRPWSLGPVICYEDILQDYLRGVGRLHPNLLVNLTSDSWFGARAAPWEHLALSVFASVELRVTLVRAVNSGVSALVDPNGRLLQKSYANDPYRNPRDADGMVVDAPGLTGGHTVFVAVGNLFAYLCIVATLVCFFLAVRSQRKC